MRRAGFPHRGARLRDDSTPTGLDRWSARDGGSDTRRVLDPIVQRASVSAECCCPVSPELECRNFLTNATGGLVFCHELFRSYKAVGVIVRNSHEMQGRDVPARRPARTLPDREPDSAELASAHTVGASSRRWNSRQVAATCRVCHQAAKLAVSVAIWDGYGGITGALDDRGASNTEIVASIRCCVPHQVRPCGVARIRRTAIRYPRPIDEPDEAHHKRITSNDFAAGDADVSITFPRFGEKPRLAQRTRGILLAQVTGRDHYEFET